MQRLQTPAFVKAVGIGVDHVPLELEQQVEAKLVVMMHKHWSTLIVFFSYLQAPPALESVVHTLYSVFLWDTDLLPPGRKSDYGSVWRTCDWAVFEGRTEYTLFKRFWCLWAFQCSCSKYILMIILKLYTWGPCMCRSHILTPSHFHMPLPKVRRELCSPLEDTETSRGQIHLLAASAGLRITK